MNPSSGYKINLKIYENNRRKNKHIFFLVVWTIVPVQLAATVTRLWIRKGCLKVEEGLEHFKAMLISKPADAKSALCKWTASTLKKFKPRAEDDSTVPSIHWYYLKQTELKHFWWACVSVCTPTSNEQPLRGIISNYSISWPHSHIQVFAEIVLAVSVGLKSKIATYYSIFACQLQLYCVGLLQRVSKVFFSLCWDIPKKTGWRPLIMQNFNNSH